MMFLNHQIRELRLACLILAVISVVIAPIMAIIFDEGKFGEHKTELFLTLVEPEH
mgnify:CR=1 FL=1